MHYKFKFYRVKIVYGFFKRDICLNFMKKYLNYKVFFIINIIITQVYNFKSIIIYNDNILFLISLLRYTYLQEETHVLNHYVYSSSAQAVEHVAQFDAKERA
jgi:hypothetical protein